MIREVLYCAFMCVFGPVILFFMAVYLLFYVTVSGKVDWDDIRNGGRDGRHDRKEG